VVLNMSSLEMNTMKEFRKKKNLTMKRMTQITLHQKRPQMTLKLYQPIVLLNLSQANRKNNWRPMKMVIATVLKMLQAETKQASKT